MHKWMNYGMKIAKDAKGDNRVGFLGNGKYCYFDGHEFKVKEWKLTLKDIINQVERILSH
jgi:hypothetical protein